VRRIEQLIRHYSSRTTEFKEYIARGTEYLDFVALEENDLIFINRGLTEYQPPERLVALYPKEGTFWHEHPMGIVTAPWVTAEQQEAARVFVDFVLTPDIQQQVVAQGFRPANLDVPIGFPFVEENGVDPNQPTTVLDVPDPEVIAAIQQSWALVKKQADVLLVIDTSGSMSNDNKIGQAQEAALAFIEAMESNNRVGLLTFDDEIDLRVPIDDFERVREQLYSQIRSLRADGGTELYAAVQEAVSLMNQQSDESRIRAVVILSDGEDTGELGISLQAAINAINASTDELNPVIVIPVAYGADADIQTLNAIARSSNTSVQSGDPANIRRVLDLIGSYF
jgi:Ca-activated chloride channel family protein